MSVRALNACHGTPTRPAQIMTARALNARNGNPTRRRHRS